MSGQHLVLSKCELLPKLLPLPPSSFSKVADFQSFKKCITILSVIGVTNFIILTYFFRILYIKYNDFICMEKVWARVGRGCGISYRFMRGPGLVCDAYQSKSCVKIDKHRQHVLNVSHVPDTLLST